MIFDLWLFDLCNFVLSKDKKVAWAGPDWKFFADKESIKTLIDQDDVFCLVHCRFSGPAEDEDIEFLYWLRDFYKNTQKNTQLIYIHNDEHPMLHGIKNIHFLYFPEYFAYYYPLYASAKIEAAKLEKKFLCINKRSSVHRQITYRGFYNDDLLKDSYFSYLGQSGYLGEINDTNSNDIIKVKAHTWVAEHWPEAARWTDPAESFVYLDDHDKNLIDKDFSIWNSNQGFESGETEPTWILDAKYYQTSFCSVVIETSPSSERINFSEKTVRAIAMGHPLILIGSQGSVKTLREFGFDMYDDILDHSYDQIENDVLRFRKAWDCIKKISSIPLEELQEISQRLINRRKRNKEHLRSMYYKMFDRENELALETGRILGCAVTIPSHKSYKKNNI